MRWAHAVGCTSSTISCSNTFDPNFSMRLVGSRVDSSAHAAYFWRVFEESLHVAGVVGLAAVGQISPIHPMRDREHVANPVTALVTRGFSVSSESNVD
jgi:hypothetical protein